MGSRLSRTPKLVLLHVVFRSLKTFETFQTACESLELRDDLTYLG
jgi:hypothetical protein